MSRIQDRLSNRHGFIPFVTAGDPDLGTSLAICLKLAELGADVIELGVPFSDPMADGPTIQRSSQRALDKDVTFDDVLTLAAEFRKQSDVPLVLFSYFNPLLQFGIDEFASAAAGSGINGLLLTDVIDNEATQISTRLTEHEIDLISLVAPTTTDERLAVICTNARGFIYAVSRAGVTGAQNETSSSANELVERVRKFTELPIAVGFGISNVDQIAEVWKYADAAVVGSAIVNVIERAEKGREVEDVETFIWQLLPAVANDGLET